MKITAPAREFSQALALVNSAASPANANASSNPILACVMVEADEDGLYLAATDGAWVGIRTRVEADIERHGCAAPASKLFADLVGSLAAGENSGSRLTLETSGGKVLVTDAYGHSYDLPSQNADDFPSVKHGVGPEDGAFPVSAEAFSRCIAKVVRSVAKDDARPVLSGALTGFGLAPASEETPGEDGPVVMRMVTTDSYRLSIQETAQYTGEDGSGEGLAPECRKSIANIPRTAMKVFERVRRYEASRQAARETGGVEHPAPEHPAEERSAEEPSAAAYSGEGGAANATALATALATAPAPAVSAEGADSASGAGTLWAARDEGKMILTLAQTTLTVTTIHGNYPDYQRLLPESFAAAFCVNRRQLMASLKRMSLLCHVSGGPPTPVVLTLRDAEASARSSAMSDGLSDSGTQNSLTEAGFAGGTPSGYTVEVSGRTADRGAGSDVLFAEFADNTDAGEPGTGASAGADGFSLGFNPEYLIDGVAAIPGETIIFYVNGSDKPVVITGRRSDAEASDAADAGGNRDANGHAAENASAPALAEELDLSRPAESVEGFLHLLMPMRHPYEK